MSIQLVNLPPIDPYGITGPVRMMGGPLLMRPVTLDTEYGQYAKWLYLGTAGDVSYVGWDGVTVNMVALLAGALHPIFSTKINSSGTTAANILWGA